MSVRFPSAAEPRPELLKEERRRKPHPKDAESRRKPWLTENLRKNGSGSLKRCAEKDAKARQERRRDDWKQAGERIGQSRRAASWRAIDPHAVTLARSNM